MSVDPLDDARTMKQEEELDYPVLYGLDCESVAEKTGLFYDEDDLFFHATNFLLQDGQIVQSTYSSGPIGRMEPEHVSGLVEFYQSQEAN